MTDKQLAILLKINGDNKQGKAALTQISRILDDLPGDAQKASRGMSAAFKTSLSGIRKDLNDTFKFSAGQVLADGLQGAISGVKQFSSESIIEFRSYEDALTGAAKTTGIKGDDLKELSGTLRQSALDLKGLGEGAATQMAEITEIAGQLGIAQDKISSGKFKAASEELAGFAEVIAKGKIALPEFTGGVSEIADAAAQVIQLHGESSSAAEGILSTYNELANTTGANAKQISTFVNSFTMAPQLKISIEEAAGIGATLVSLGQDANQGATNYQGAISQIFQGTKRSVSALETALQGSTSAQEKLSQILGRTKGETESFYEYFKKAMAADAVSSVNTLLESIGEIPNSVTQTQTSLDIFGREGARTMNALIGNTDKVTANINKGTEARKQSISIEQEFQTALQKQGTAFDELNSYVEDVKISIGEGLTGALSEVAKTDITPAVEQFRTWVQESDQARVFFETTLPGAIKGTITVIEGMITVLGGFHNAIAKTAQFVGESFDKLTSHQTTLSREVQEVAEVTGEYAAIQAEQMAYMGEYTNVVGAMIQPLEQAEQALENAKTATEEYGEATAAALDNIDWSAALDSLNEIGHQHGDLISGNQRLNQSFQAVFMGLHQATMQSIEPSDALKAKFVELQEELTRLGIIAYGNSVFPDMTDAMQVSQAQAQALTAEMTAMTAEVVALDEAYKTTNVAIKEKQRLSEDLKRQIRDLNVEYRAAGKEEKEGIRAAIVELQNKRSVLTNEISLLKEKAGAQKDEVAQQKEAVKATQERLKAAEWLAAQQQKSAEAMQRHWQEERDANQQILAMQRERAADSISYLNDLSTAAKERLMEEGDIVDTLEKQGIILDENQQLAARLLQRDYQRKKALEAQTQELEKQFMTTAEIGQAMSENLGKLSGGIGELGGMFGLLDEGGAKLRSEYQAQEDALSDLELQRKQLQLTMLDASDEERDAIKQQIDTIDTQIERNRLELDIAKQTGDAYEQIDPSPLTKALHGLEDVRKYAEIPGTIRDIKDAVGGLLGGEGLGGLGSALSGLLGPLGNLGGLGSSLTGILGGGLSGALGSVSSAASGLLGGLGGLGGALGGIAAAAGPLALAGGAIFGVWKGISALFGDVKSEGTKAAEAFQDFVASNISGGAEMEAALKTNFNAMRAAGFDYSVFLQATGTTMDQTFGGISANWEQGTTAMDQFVLAVGRATGNMEKAPQVSLQMMASFQDMGLSAEEAGLKMLEIAEASGATEAEMQALRDALSGVQGQLSGAGEEGGLTTDSLDSAKAAAGEFKGEVDALSGSLSDVSGKLSGAGTEGATTAAIFTTGDTAAKALDSTVTGLSGNVEALTTAMGQQGVSVLETSNMFGVAGLSATALSGDVDALASMTGLAGEELNNLRVLLAELPEEKRIQLILEQQGSVPQMATGGMITSDMAAVIYNERGMEAVRHRSGSVSLLTTPGPALGLFAVGDEIIPHHRVPDILRRYPVVQTRASGGRVEAMLPGSEPVVIQVDIHDNHFHGEMDVRRVVTQAMQQSANKLAARRRRGR